MITNAHSEAIIKVKTGLDAKYFYLFFADKGLAGIKTKEYFGLFLKWFANMILVIFPQFPLAKCFISSSRKQKKENYKRKSEGVIHKKRPNGDTLPVNKCLNIQTISYDISAIFAPEMRKIIIAIDGYSACGKSTTAIEVARKLGYVHIDTGAMYRAVTLFFLDNNIPFDVENPSMLTALDRIDLTFEVNPASGHSEICLNGKNVEEAVRTFRVSALVSEVSALPSVRAKMVALQQKMGAQKGIVMDGRDIGTVVFPNAALKIFMTATMAKRVERRMLDLKNRGLRQTEAEVEENIRHRDHIDTTRKESPLRMAEDAILLDNTELKFEEQVDFVVQKAIEKLGKEN